MTSQTKTLTLFSTALLLPALVACKGTDQPSSSAPEPQTQAAYQVGVLLSGQFTQLGLLSFDSQNRGNLRLTAEDSQPAECRRLQKVWDEVSRMDVIEVKRGKPTPEGEELVGDTVERRSNDYPLAVLDFLANEHGFPYVIP
jgi:hypothetical protein